MSKIDMLIIAWEVKECLPNATFKVIIIDENYPKDMEILCHVSWKMRMHYIKILPWDKVRLEMTPYDLSKWRITYRFRNDADFKKQMEKEEENN